MRTNRVTRTKGMERNWLFPFMCEFFRIQNENNNFFSRFLVRVWAREPLYAHKLPYTQAQRTHRVSKWVSCPCVIIIFAAFPVWLCFVFFSRSLLPSLFAARCTFNSEENNKNRVYWERCVWVCAIWADEICPHRARRCSTLTWAIFVFSNKTPGFTKGWVNLFRK